MLIKNGQNIYTVDSSDLLTVYDLFENGSEPVRPYARNILIFRDDIDYFEPIILPDILKSSDRIEKHKTGRFIYKSYMKVFPNPARKYVIVEYNLQERYREGCNGVLKLIDIHGQEMIRKEIHKAKDQELIHTSLLPAGTYICTLTYGSDLMEIKKIVIIE